MMSRTHLDEGDDERAQRRRSCVVPQTFPKRLPEGVVVNLDTRREARGARAVVVRSRFSRWCRSRVEKIPVTRSLNERSGTITGDRSK